MKRKTIVLFLVLVVAMLLGATLLWRRLNWKEYPSSVREKFHENRTLFDDLIHITSKAGFSLEAGPDYVRTDGATYRVTETGDWSSSDGPNIGFEELLHRGSLSPRDYSVMMSVIEIFEAKCVRRILFTTWSIEVVLKEPSGWPGGTSYSILWDPHEPWENGGHDPRYDKLVDFGGDWYWRKDRW